MLTRDDDNQSYEEGEEDYFEGNKENFPKKIYCPCYRCQNDQDGAAWIYDYNEDQEPGYASHDDNGYDSYDYSTDDLEALFCDEPMPPALTPAPWRLKSMIQASWI